MKVLVTGSSGFIGSALVPFLEDRGHTVLRLVRRRPEPNGTEISWDPVAGEIDRAGLAGVEAVVHLAGENIASGRWTAARKRRIMDSRVEGTRLLSETLAGLDPLPKVLASASAKDYYGAGAPIPSQRQSRRAEGSFQRSFASGRGRPSLPRPEASGWLTCARAWC